MEDNQTLESYCTEQEDQTPMCRTDQEYGMSGADPYVDDKSSRSEALASWANQENEAVDNAQNIDDESVRSKKLQNLSNEVQCNEVNEPRTCGGEFPLRRRSSQKFLLNSEFINFKTKTYIKKSYSVSEQDSFYGAKRAGFDVEYKPSDHKLKIVMPVEFMGPTNLNSLDPDIVRPNTMSVDIPQDFKDEYMDCVKHVWSNKHKLYLDVNDAKSNGLCCDWSYVNPVDVDVSVEEIKECKVDPIYKIYHNPDYHYRDATASNYVIFSGATYNRNLQSPFAHESRHQIGIEGDYEKQRDLQRTFAHEFGHQIGLGDEYAVNSTKARINDEEVCVYRTPVLRAYERTKYKRQYTLPKEKKLFNHQGIDYSAELKTFDGKKGFVLYADGKELTERFPGLKSHKPVEITDGNVTHYVYFYDILEAEEEPGPRTYDFEKIIGKKGKIYHNYKEYSVIKGSDNWGYFYYLEDKDGNTKKEYLDGTYTSHFDMVTEQFGEAYALKHATMYNEVDTLSERAGNDDKEEYGKSVENALYIMSDWGNDVKPHHYITFLKGMVGAIQDEYPVSESEEAPNMEKDWKIE